MAYERITKDTKLGPGDHWIEVTRGMSGWFAVEVWMNNQDASLGPFPEPWDTGVGRYATEAEACVEALALAAEKGLPYQLTYLPGSPEYRTAFERMTAT